MYGLTSRESLSKRQTKWTREVDTAVRGNPAQRAISQTPVQNIVRGSIITTDISGAMVESMSGDFNIPKQQTQIHSQFDIRSNRFIDDGKNGIIDTSGQSRSHLGTTSRREPNKTFKNHIMDILPEESDTVIFEKEIERLTIMYTEIKRAYDDLKQNQTKLEKELTVLQRDHTSTSDLSARINRLEHDQTLSADVINVRVEKLEHKSDMSSVISRITNLEQSSYHSNSSKQNIIKSIIDNSSEFSALTDVDIKRSDMGYREFIPYFIKEDHVGRDNLSRLTELNLKMVVEILGSYSETPIIYPFGQEKELPRFAELTLDMSFRDADKTMSGTAYGILKRRTDGIYTILLTELYSDGEASGIEKYTLPITLTCETRLALE